MSGSVLPSVDRLLRNDDARGLIAAHGRTRVANAIRQVLGSARDTRTPGGAPAPLTEDDVLRLAQATLTAADAATLRQVFNLTGTVLHTNLGRAPLPQEAVDAMVNAARHPVDLEFDLERGARGDRDDHLEPLLCALTGAEAATVVNNNAAAVLLVLNTLARGKEVPTSRGELIEIGGSFRMPEIMARAGCRLREVGTTNRVHLRDYADAIGPKTALVMKVHTSNYAIVGFTASVHERELAALCRERSLPLVVDLGSGTLVDLQVFGLPHEPTPAESVRNGADLVTFSGDKLLGGPQAGVIVGRADLVDRIRRNPLKRALRVDKVTMAALGAVLQLYREPERLAARLPVLRLLTRPLEEIRGVATRMRPYVARAAGESMDVQVVDCGSEIGSGALPVRELPSAGLALIPRVSRGRGSALTRLAASFRALPIPVLGRVTDDRLILDCRCLEDEDEFAALFVGCL